MLARYRAETGRGDLVEESLKEMAAAVAEEEPGCLVYRASRSLEDPDVFVLYEEYVDQAALEAHRETPHFRRLIEGTVVPVLVSRDREILAPILDATGGPQAG
jgi:quinol monooxygenase YgiN